METEKENDVIFCLKFDEIRYIEDKQEIHEYIKNRLRDAFGECEFLIDLKNVKKWCGDNIHIPITFKNESDKKQFLSIQNFYNKIILDTVTGDLPPVGISLRDHVFNTKLVGDYSKIRKLIPTRESMEKQAFIDSLKYIKQYSLKKIKSLITPSKFA